MSSRNDVYIIPDSDDDDNVVAPPAEEWEAGFEEDELHEDEEDDEAEVEEEVEEGYGLESEEEAEDDEEDIVPALPASHRQPQIKQPAADPRALPAAVPKHTKAQPLCDASTFTDLPADVEDALITGLNELLMTVAGPGLARHVALNRTAPLSTVSAPTAELRSIYDTLTAENGVKYKRRRLESPPLQEKARKMTDDELARINCVYQTFIASARACQSAIANLAVTAAKAAERQDEPAQHLHQPSILHTLEKLESILREGRLRHRSDDAQTAKTSSSQPTLKPTGAATAPVGRGVAEHAAICAREGVASIQPLYDELIQLRKLKKSMMVQESGMLRSTITAQKELLNKRLADVAKQHVVESQAFAGSIRAVHGAQKGVSLLQELDELSKIGAMITAQVRNLRALDSELSPVFSSDPSQAILSPKRNASAASTHLVEGLIKENAVLSSELKLAQAHVRRLEAAEAEASRHTSTISPHTIEEASLRRIGSEFSTRLRETLDCVGNLFGWKIHSIDKIANKAWKVELSIGFPGTPGEVRTFTVEGDGGCIAHSVELYKGFQVFYAEFRKKKELEEKMLREAPPPAVAVAIAPEPSAEPVPEATAPSPPVQPTPVAAQTEVDPEPQQTSLQEDSVPAGGGDAAAAGDSVEAKCDDGNSSCTEILPPGGSDVEEEEGEEDEEEDQAPATDDVLQRWKRPREENSGEGPAFTDASTAAASTAEAVLTAPPAEIVAVAVVAATDVPLAHHATPSPAATETAAVVLGTPPAYAVPVNEVSFDDGGFFSLT